MGVRDLVQRHPLVVYFSLAYVFSALALIVVGLPDLSGTKPVQAGAFAMFPVLVVGVGASGFGLTALVRGRDGVSEMGQRVTRWRLGRWALLALVPPAAVTGVLLAWRVLVSPAFAQDPTIGFFLFGVGVGAVAGFFERDRMDGLCLRTDELAIRSSARSSVLGVLWGLWHFPVIDSLGRKPACSVLARVPHRVRRGDDRHARTDLMALYQHRQRAISATAARMLHRVARGS